MQGHRAAFEAAGCRVSEGVDMSGMTTFHIGGAADWLVVAPSAQAVADVLRHCRESGLPVLLIGNGSDLLVSDEGIEGVVLRMDPMAQPVTVDEERHRLTAFGGTAINRVCCVARDHALTGMEFAYGIPGSVGGGVYMNAGAYGGQLSDVLVEATLLSPVDGTTRRLPVDQLQLDYRHSLLMETGEIAVEATFQLQPGDRDTIAARMEELMAKRRSKQPLEYPSAGSFFKRPAGHFAAALIDQCGLKGFSIGDAQVSEKHAGFVVNRGQATCRDMIALGREVSRLVKETFGVTLEPEVELVGRNVHW
ncbi:MAG: UDP-N-acetylmuramate dehydrogenase [Acutalibacteraceae bacterium]